MSTVWDAADFFALGYDILASDQYVPSFAQGIVDEWYVEEAVQQRRRQVRDQVLATGRLSAADARAADGGGPELLATLLAIDDAFAEVLFPPDTGCSEGMYDYVERWEERRILNTSASPGALLPRWSRPGRASGGSLRHPRDPFAYLTRVPEPLWSRCRHVVIPRYHDVACESYDVRVACLPFLENLDELDLQVIPEGPHRGYRAQAADQPALAARVSTALDALVESGADIALLPECALSPNLLAVWREVLKGRRTGRLKWLMAGTGLFDRGHPRPASTAILLSTRDGALIGSQDKQFGFSLQPHQIQNWGLNRIPQDDRVWDESISVGTELTIFDSSKLRAAIAVCEDASRTDTLAPSIRESGVTLLMVPIFAREIDRQGWEESSGQLHMLESGAHVVISNSLAVARNMQERKQAEENGHLEASPPEDGQPDNGRPPLPPVLSSLFVPSTSQLETYVEPKPGLATSGCERTVFELFAE
jgi:predicted amidohydrolase